MSPTPARPVVRCFAREDEGLVDEWPVPLDSDAIRALVPAAASDAALQEIHPVTRDIAEQLVGALFGEFAEPVDFYLEPAAFSPPE